MATKDEFKSKKVLLADDSSTARQIIKRELIMMGFEDQNIRDAADGEQALKFLAKTEFHMIISDWHMPNMDGLELLRTVKGDGRLKSIPFLMLTTEAEKDKISKAFESSADQYIGKPFSSAPFQQTINKLLLGSTSYEDKKVLVIDDSAVLRAILAKNLEQVGFLKDNITESKDGEEGLEKMMVDKFDLVITDWYMPKMDGLEFVKLMKDKDHLKNVPLLMVTSEMDGRKELEAFRAGISAYIIKPFTANDLESKIKEVF
ncbi:MAG: response regulator [Cyclobacteriaceae bacterium]|nr:response regulator [Cyclobacteriaceae bacterium]